jgi:aconitate hydratase
LAEVKGKCTTDHISSAGPWLKYRGHLDKISDNLLLGAVNSYHEGEVGRGKNILNNKIKSFPHIAREYKKRGLKWIIVGDNNYGEGSSRDVMGVRKKYPYYIPIMNLNSIGFAQVPPLICCVL